MDTVPSGFSSMLCIRESRRSWCWRSPSVWGRRILRCRVPVRRATTASGVQLDCYRLWMRAPFPRRLRILIALALVLAQCFRPLPFLT